MSDNWLTDVIAKENAYDEGYEAGKQAATEQIFAELHELLYIRVEPEVTTTGSIITTSPDGLYLNYNDYTAIRKKYGVE